MANPTTNFGWVMPTSASLVTNLPADFNTFGQAVDTSMSELLGGTTGQVLSKTSNTSMDFTWVTPTDQTPLTTKGDLFTFTTLDARLAVGSNTAPLVADSAEATGLRWDSNAWTSYTPGFSAVGTPAVIGNGTITGAYKQRGKTIQGRVSFTAGSTTTFGTADLLFGTPSGLTAVATGVSVVAWGYAFDTSAATYYQFFADNVVTTAFSPRIFNAAGAYTTLATVTSTIPFTWATGDTVNFYFSYEVA